MSNPVDPELRTSDFDYALPEELIAQTPLVRRDASRLLVLDKLSGEIDHRHFVDLPNLLSPGDLIVANDSRVIRGRLRGRRAPTGGHVELLLLRQVDESGWEALAKPSRRLHPGDRILIEPVNPDSHMQFPIIIEQKLDEGSVTIRFESGELDLEAFGIMPLPPYIHSSLQHAERYQTLYAKNPGSAAAPTAGLHMTPEVRQQLEENGIGWAEVTLHIGLDTFRPVSVDRLAEHHMHSEWCRVSLESVAAIQETRMRGGRVIALGTTAARTLETAGQRWLGTEAAPFADDTSIFITPGYEWTLVDGLITNFHLPKSTLLMMVSALAGRDSILSAYRAAIEADYRFYSFGDAMLIR